MLTEYLAEATLTERRDELLRYAMAAEAQRLNGHTGLLSRLFRGRYAGRRANRARSAASAAGHSLSMME
jgi:hypothetical protein